MEIRLKSALFLALTADINMFTNAFVPSSRLVVARAVESRRAETASSTARFAQSHVAPLNFQEATMEAMDIGEIQKNEESTDLLSVPASGLAVELEEPEHTMLETPPDAFQLMADKGRYTAEKSKLKTFVASLMGGFYIGIGGMLSLAVCGNIPAITAANPGLSRLFFATLFPVSILLSLQTGGQLFTGNAAKVTAAICEGKAAKRDLFKSLGLSYIGNLLAASTFAVLCKYSGVLAGGAANLAVAQLAVKTSMGLGPLLVKAFMCNWLVCIAVYLSFQAKDMGGKYLSIFLPISSLMAMGFEHSVANMFFLPAGLLCSTGLTIGDVVFKNLIPVSIANAVSGSLMVGVMFSFLFGKLGKK